MMKNRIHGMIPPLLSGLSMRTELSATSGPTASTTPPTRTAPARPDLAAQADAAAGAGAVTIADAAPATPTEAGQLSDHSQVIDATTLQQSVDSLNRFVQPREGSIEFTLDESSGKALLQVVDTETKAVLLQVPSKQALALSQGIGQTTGQLIKDSA